MMFEVTILNNRTRHLVNSDRIQTIAKEPDGKAKIWFDDEDAIITDQQYDSIIDVVRNDHTVRVWSDEDERYTFPR